MLVPIFMLALVLKTPEPPTDLGASLVTACRAYLRVTEDDATAPEEDWTNGAVCVEFIKSYAAANNLASNSICMKRTSFAHIAGVYIKFMKGSPEYFTQRRSSGLREALAAQYPCQAPPQRISETPKKNTSNGKD